MENKDDVVLKVKIPKFLTGMFSKKKEQPKKQKPVKEQVVKPLTKKVEEDIKVTHMSFEKQYREKKERTKIEPIEAISPSNNHLTEKQIRKIYVMDHNTPILNEISTFRRPVDIFNKLIVKTCANIIYHPTDKHQHYIDITIDSDLTDRVYFTVDNGTLTIDLKAGTYYNIKKFVVDVYSPYLTEVDMKGSGNFECYDRIMLSNFNLKISGSADAKIHHIECEMLSIIISGGGNVNIAGNCQNAEMKISGSGDLCASKLYTKNAITKISGSGEIDISVSENLNAKVSGSGYIIYKGNPNVIEKVTGSGKIRRKK